jgi:hypothetical protein
MRAIIDGKEYIVMPSDFSDTTGRQDPGIQSHWTVLRYEGDNIGQGVLMDLGKNYGYRLVIRGNKGGQTSTEYTKEQVTLIPD